jgi:Xaa-Pro aminopeptidase
MTRVIYLGKANNEEKQFYHLLLQSQLEAISHIQHNRSFKKLDNIARNNLAEYSSHFIHSLGHGIGIDVHESPSFFDNSRINHNQVFTIEPGIYFPGKFGLRIEDTVHFNNKVTVLTKAPKDLIEITIK